MPKFVILLLACAAASGNGPSRWQPSGPWGGSATAIAIDPNNPDHLLAGARSSLIFHSSNRGDRWSRLAFPRHFLGVVTALLIDPADGRRYIAAISAPGSEYGGVWYSDDAGGSWSQSAGVAGISALALAVWSKDPTRMAAGTRDGVWLSKDAGRSFERISAPWNHELRGVTAVAFDPADSNVIYAGTTHLPWKTTDGGATWKSIHSGMLDDSDVFSIYIDPKAPSRVFASACSGIYRSETAGESWTKFGGIPGTHRRTHVIRLHPVRRDTIFAGTTLGLLQSTDGGKSFKTLNTLHILSMAFDPGNPERFYLATERTGLFRSDDGGKTLIPINEGFVHRRAIDWSGTKEAVFLNVVQDGSAGGVFSSYDNGRNWKLAASGAALKDNHLSSIASCPNLPEVVFSGSETALVRSTDGGKSFSHIKLPGPLNAIACVAVPGAAKPALLAGTKKGLFRSSDLGSSWLPVKLTTAPIQHNVQAFHTSPNAPARLAVRTTQAVYLSDDGGVAWRALNILFPVSMINDLALLGGAGSPILVATPQGLYISNDNGKTWSMSSQGLAEGSVMTLAARPGRPNEVYAGQFGTLYRSVDSGRTWGAISGSLITEATLRKLLFPAAESSLLLGLTYDLGVFYLDLSEL